MAAYFAPIARLLGDLVVSLPPLQSLIQAGEEVCLIIRSPAQEGIASRIPGLASVIKETDYLKLAQGKPQRIYNLREHPLQSDHVWGSPDFYKQYPGFSISEVIKQICLDMGIADGQGTLTPLLTQQRPDCAGKILLIPGSSAPIKTWTSTQWLTLYQELKSLGRQAVMIGEPRVNSQISGLMKAGMPWVPTRTLADALDALSSSAGVVSVDTGLMHLAVHQGIPTIGISREYTMFLRQYPHARYIIAPTCSTNCKAREFAFSPNAETYFNDWSLEQTLNYWGSLNCLEALPCMSLITVETVLEQIRESGLL